MNDAAREIVPLTRPPSATVQVPGSKSITNRAVLLAALADGRSELGGVLFSDDTRYMVAALRSLGVAVEEDEKAARLIVDGCGGNWPAREADLFVGNAGTAMRFLAAAACLGHGRYRIDGTARMRERPIDDLIAALRQLGVTISCEPSGTPPVVIEARGLLGGSTELSAERSSQFLSALLLVAPYAQSDLAIHLRGRVIAQPYVEMTLAMMTQWGVRRFLRKGWEEFSVESGQQYLPRAYAIEPDASSAHYFWAAAALTGGRVTVEGLTLDSLQGDVRFGLCLQAMGAAFFPEGGGMTLIGPNELKGIDVDLNDMSDTAPTLGAIAPFCSGPVRIRNVAHLRWQESDRLRAVATELARLGATVHEHDDGLEIEPSALHGGDVQTYDDHRVAMAFALIGLKVPGIRILDPGCTAKTFPDYFERLEMLRR